MKKLKIVIITTIIYIGLIFLNTKVLAVSTGITENDTTRIREKASTKSETVTLVSMNQKVEIEAEEGDWYKVKCKVNDITYSGYIRKDMLKVDEEKESTSQEDKTQNQEKEVDKVEEDNQKIEITEKSKVKTQSDIEIRILPLINSNKTGVIGKQTDIEITEILGKWCYVVAGEQNGWVMKTQLESNVKNSDTEINNEDTKNNAEETEKETTKSLNKTLYVTSETVNLREEATSNSKSLLQLTKNTAVTQIELVNNTWSKVQVGETIGYVSNVYLSEKKTEVTSRGETTSREKKEVTAQETKKTEEVKTETTETIEKQKETTKKTETATNKVEETKEASSKKGADIVATAKKYLGYKYVSGGASPKTGFDCSGFTSYVYKENGYSINRVSSAQTLNGKKVSKSDLQLGDLVFFKGRSSSSIGHVGIYIGGNQFIHAANSRKGVIITSLSESYYAARYVTATRVVK